MGMIIWEDDKLVVLATGYKNGSTNSKTGAMVQTYILLKDVSPTEAVKTGQDRAICGDCPHRGDKGKNRSCYVTVFQGPLSVWKNYAAGRADRFDAEKLAGKPLRIGAYGDPAMVPFEVWESLAAQATTVTGYTRQWVNGAADPRMASLCMASVVSAAEATEAVVRGWRPFFVRPAGTTKVLGSIVCPASAEAGKKTTCASCGICSGTSATQTRMVTIEAHGIGRKYVSS